MDTKLLLVLTATTILAGCQYPMGLTKTQWKALPPEQQAEYRRQQSIIDEQRRREQAEIAAREKAEAAERARIEEMRIAARYENARYGDIVTVTIEGGLIDFGKHRAYEAVRFDLVRGQRKLVEITQLGNSSIKVTVPVRLSEDGQTFYFDENARDRIALINANNAWQNGKRYESLAIHDTSSKSLASGISIHLEYKRPGPWPSVRPTSGKPL